MTEQVAAVQRMQDFIAAHLDEEITLADLARAAMFLPWYSYRLFKSLTGLTVSDYIRRLRLARSALKLKNEGCRIVDAAFALGFGSVDGYTRAFVREFGLTPGAYTKHPVPVALFVPYGVKFQALRKDFKMTNDTKTVFIQTIHKPERRVLVRRGQRAADHFAYCAEVGCDVWGLLLSMDSLCGEPVSLWLPDKYRRPNISVYVQGVEIAADADAPIPEGFDVISLLEADYLMFQGEPFAEEDYCEAITAVQQAMNKYDPAVIGLAWDDENPRIQLEPRGERGYIEMRAVKPRAR